MFQLYPQGAGKNKTGTENKSPIDSWSVSFPTSHSFISFTATMTPFLHPPHQRFFLHKNENYKWNLLTQALQLVEIYISNTFRLSWCICVCLCPLFYFWISHLSDTGRFIHFDSSSNSSGLWLIFQLCPFFEFEY